VNIDLEVWHAVDSPFEDFDDWAEALTFGICTACGADVWSGRTGWWHTGSRLCPDRQLRTPGFSPDL
jgi:hypothetical protein